MDQIKEAFNKVKQDIDFLKQEINSISSNFLDIKNEIIKLNEIIKTEVIEKNIPTQNKIFSATSTHPSTHHTSFKPLKEQNIAISTGNGGVPTDRQTDRQTDEQTKFHINRDLNSIDNAVDILDSLDNLKKEIRLKFKRLTDQEFLVFSTLYQLEEEIGYTDYKTLSNKLNLTESSIRDYIGRLIKKGIPVEKNKINNKNIQLSISQNLKKIVTLPTILQLRDL